MPLPMDVIERVREILDQPCERPIEGGAPADQHIVVPQPKPFRVRKPHDFPQPPPHPVALDRIADLLRHRKTDPCRPGVGACAGLQNESRRGGTRAGRDAEEIRPLAQSFHGHGQAGRLRR
jgi:hypothetical protein